MMIIARKFSFGFILSLCFIFINHIHAKDNIITTDSRIKTYVYSPHEVYHLVLHNGFQSYIEFQRDEYIEDISLGEEYAWEMKHNKNRLFIRPLQVNILTNMIITTNKRTYKFDLVSKELGEEYSDELVYSVNFHYI